MISSRVVMTNLTAANKTKEKILYECKETH